MDLDIADQCPGYGLKLLTGHIFGFDDEREKYGPILGLDRGVDPATAKAGYVGIGSAFVPQIARALYRCPRCGADPVIEAPDDCEEPTN